MAEPGNDRINLSRQAYILSVNRTSLYRQPPTTTWPQWVSQKDLSIAIFLLKLSNLPLVFGQLI